MIALYFQQSRGIVFYAHGCKSIIYYYLKKLKVKRIKVQNDIDQTRKTQKLNIGMLQLVIKEITPFINHYHFIINTSENCGYLCKNPGYAPLQFNCRSLISINKGPEFALRFSIFFLVCQSWSRIQLVFFCFLPLSLWWFSKPFMKNLF